MDDEKFRLGNNGYEEKNFFDSDLNIRELIIE
jgi:hypothetical protein